jgi:hypothetical protein
MRILHTVEFYEPRRGGAEEVIKQLSERMVLHGHEVTVATTYHPSRTSGYIQGVADERAPYVLFVMLNPSTANAVNDDPTIRSCMRIARALGYGALHVVNLWDYITPDPKALRAWVIANGLGDRVDPHGGPPPDLLDMVIRSKHAALTLCGWGTWGGWFPKRVADVMECLTAPHALHVTKDGHPGHPLYLPKTATPKPYRP